MQQEEKKQIGTTDDLSKDMIFEGDEYKNKEGESQSTASEGELVKVDKNQQDVESDSTVQSNDVKPSENAAKNTEPQVTNDDPTHIPTLAEDESIEKTGDDISS